MENKKYFSDSLSEYLAKYGILVEAEEYARTNAVGIDQLGYKRGSQSLWWAFSWSDTTEGYAFWSNHHERFLNSQRSTNLLK